MKKTNTACHFAIKRYFPLVITLLFLFFSLMSCKGKSGEKSDTTAPVTQSINVEDSILNPE